MSGAHIDSLVLILTARCNLRCAYCCQTAKMPLSMDWDTLRRSIDLVLDCPSKAVRLFFSGGEPLLAWIMLRNAVEYAACRAPSDKQIRYGIGTNGLLISDQIAEFLDRHQFRVQLSFDGVALAQDRRCVGSFPILDGLLDRLRLKRPDLFRERLRISTVQIPATLPHFADSIRYLMEKGVREITVSPSVTPSPGWAEDGIGTLEAQFRRIYDDSMRRLEKTGEVPLTLFRKSRKQDHIADNPGTCNAVKGKTLAVDAGGQVYGCVLFAESFLGSRSEFLRRRLGPLRMGDLRDEGLGKRYAAYLEAVKKTEIFRNRERRYSSYGKCADCPYLDECRVCPVSIGCGAGDADPDRIPDFICAFNRAAFKYRSMFPCMPSPLEKLNAVLRSIAAPQQERVCDSDGGSALHPARTV